MSETEAVAAVNASSEDSPQVFYSFSLITPSKDLVMHAMRT